MQAVLADGAMVGRIFKADAVPMGMPSMWTLAFGHCESAAAVSALALHTRWHSAPIRQLGNNSLNSGVRAAALGGRAF